MDAAVIALLVIVGVIVAAIALHLIAIAASLRKISGTLTKVKGGVQAIKGQTDPITTVVGGLAGDVAAIDDDLEGLLVLVGEAQAAASAAPSPLPAAPRAAPVDALDYFDDEAADDEAADDEAGDDEAGDDDEAAAVPRKPSMREAVARARAGSRS